ncbi:metallophosphoesterase family protein [Ruegeria marina]|uniref:DNA repair exonuclease SbcCD nuclease subunit n=1 Tax=Ruegeria marina TaxID=639004 RepID=A0A1G7DZ00_9RHOB|nr:DNA repair exonuclease [Ruegeria marina]SDE56611.1 DNA repair exonuclease SbcCD nuclease subunit [Ruegeria marina]
MAFRFVHTADIHLDSPLKSLALRDEALAEVVGNATRSTFRRIVDLCLAEDVQALLIAGDLYDGSQTSMKTARFLAQEMERLAAAGIPVFVIRGNHDAASRITRELTLPENVIVFPGKSEVIRTDWNDHSVAVHGISFRDPHAPDTLLDRFGPPVKGAFNIGMLHTSLGGAQGHDPYAPCTLADLQATGFDYWALGHIHRRSIYPGATTVVMPGIPQGRDIGEAGNKSVTLVSVGDDGSVATEERHLAMAQFERLSVDCLQLSDWPDLIQALKHALRTARRDHAGEHLIVRSVLTGETPLAWRAGRDLDLLHAEAQNVAEQIGTLWIDKIEVALTTVSNTSTGGAVEELAQIIMRQSLPPDDPTVLEDVERLLKHLPRELRGLLGDSEAETTAAIADAMQQGAMEVLARLEETDG